MDKLRRIRLTYMIPEPFTKPAAVVYSNQAALLQYLLKILFMPVRMFRPQVSKHNGFKSIWNGEKVLFAALWSRYRAQRNVNMTAGDIPTHPLFGQVYRQKFMPQTRECPLQQRIVFACHIACCINIYIRLPVFRHSKVQGFTLRASGNGQQKPGRTQYVP